MNLLIYIIQLRQFVRFANSLIDMRLYSFILYELRNCSIFIQSWCHQRRRTLMIHTLLNVIMFLFIGIHYAFLEITSLKRWQKYIKMWICWDISYNCTRLSDVQTHLYDVILWFAILNEVDIFYIFIQGWCKWILIIFMICQLEFKWRHSKFNTHHKWFYDFVHITFW